MLIDRCRRVVRVRARAIDFFLYIVIGIVVVAALLVTDLRLSHQAFIRWGGLGLNTLGLFGLFVTKSRELLQTRSFWVLTGLLFCIHIAVFAVVLAVIEEWRLTWFMVMVLEYPILLFLRDKFLRSS